MWGLGPTITFRWFEYNFEFSNRFISRYQQHYHQHSFSNFPTHNLNFFCKPFIVDIRTQFPTSHNLLVVWCCCCVSAWCVCTVIVNSWLHGFRPLYVNDSCGQTPLSRPYIIPFILIHYHVRDRRGAFFDFCVILIITSVGGLHLITYICWGNLPLQVLCMLCFNGSS